MTHRSPIEKLLAFGVEDFRGKVEDDVSVAEYWIENIQRVFQQLCYTPELKLECAVFLLKEEAYEWWTFTTRIKPAEQLTWEFFSTEFHKKYINEVYLQEKRGEFMGLKQNDMSVAKYEQEFIRLSRYAKVFVSTEKDMCLMFENGLNRDIRVLLASDSTQEFSRLFERALIAEQCLQRSSDDEYQENQSGSSSAGSLSRPSAKRARDSRDHSYSPPARTQRQGQRFNIPVCKHCGKRHAGRCRKLTRACFRCGSMDHLRKDCQS